VAALVESERSLDSQPGLPPSRKYECDAPAVTRRSEKDGAWQIFQLSKAHLDVPCRVLFCENARGSAKQFRKGTRQKICAGSRQ